MLESIAAEAMRVTVIAEAAVARERLAAGVPRVLLVLVDDEIVPQLWVSCGDSTP